MFRLRLFEYISKVHSYRNYVLGTPSFFFHLSWGCRNNIPNDLEIWMTIENLAKFLFIYLFIHIYQFITYTYPTVHIWIRNWDWFFFHDLVNKYRIRYFKWVTYFADSIWSKRSFTCNRLVRNLFMITKMPCTTKIRKYSNFSYALKNINIGIFYLNLL